MTTSRSDLAAQLDLPDDLLAPDYDGGSILNVANTVCQLLGVPAISPVPALRPEMLAHLGGGAKRVVLLLVDALAYPRLTAWLAEGRVPGLQRLIDQRGAAVHEISSISPSTTAAAITTFWTGVPASQHGISGYEVWLQEYGVIANMILHKPISYAGPGHLSAAGFDPRTFIRVPSMAAHLGGAGIPVHAFQHFAILNSGLSDMFMDGATRHGFATPVDMWVSLRELLEAEAGNPLYAWGYYGNYDGLSHTYGPDSERAAGEVTHFMQSFNDHLLEALSPEAAQDTVFLLVADHGQITTRKGDPHYQLINHPNFTRRLNMITGENRLAFLYVKPGQMEAVREYIEKTWPNQFHVLESDYAIHHGLFGPGEPHPELRNRCGDLTVIARGDAHLWWHPRKDDPLIGRHGGLHPQEMRVPFFSARLG